MNNVRKLVWDFTNIMFIRYAFIGGIGTIIHTAVLMIMTERLLLNPLLSSVIGFLCSLIVSFFLNVKWTFNKTARVSIFKKYFVVSVFGQVLNMLIIYFFINVLVTSYLIGHCISIIVVPIVNYFLNKKYAFK
jgi:putative flippase GtrA